jgi:hypothetical protein
VRVDVQPRVQRLGPNSSGEELTPGAVDDCYLGLLVDQPLAGTLPAPGSLLVVGPQGLGKVPECPVHGLVMPGKGRRLDVRHLSV